MMSSEIIQYAHNLADINTDNEIKLSDSVSKQQKLSNGEL